MAITKMMAVTVAGKVNEFERVVEQYIYGSEIHLENAAMVLDKKKKLVGFSEGLHYETVVKEAEDIIELADITVQNNDTHIDMTLEEMKSLLDDINASIEQERTQVAKLRKKIAKNNKIKECLEMMPTLDIDFAKLSDMKFVDFRYGHIPQSGYRMMETYLADMNVVFVKTAEIEQNVWGFYFAPKSQIHIAEEIFTSLYFVPVGLPDNLSGTPQDMMAELDKQNENLAEQISVLGDSTKQIIAGCEDKIIAVYNTARKRQKFNEVRAMAVHSSDFFYIVGWMSEKDAKALDKRMADDDAIVMCYSEKPENLKNVLTPPTKLKNNIVFRPFEMFVKMYGLPGYNEIDPTPLLAITYILFFGMMFGDLGQSAVFVIVGFLLYKKYRMELMRIVGICGISGMIFGVIYGSVFGNEEIIHGVLSPMHNITTLLISTVAMGAFVIVIAMCLNIKNAATNKNYGELLFGHNGISGLVFYVSMIGIVLNILLSLGIPNGLFIALMVVSFICIYLHEPLGELLEGKKGWLPTDPMFYVQTIFEMIEVLLSYFSNTISFLRVGAFAIVHVGMMMAVQMMAGDGGAATVIVTVLGNIIVMVLEGLVVGIQVLRLEYYEMFSRYFTGSGKVFKSLKDK